MPAAATQAAAPARSPAGRHIAAIHALKAKAGLSDDDYRALLLALTGQNSSKLLTEAQQQQVRKHLQTLADKMRPTTARAKGWVPQAQFDAARKAASPLERKLFALWAQLHKDGKLTTKPTADSMAPWVRSQVGVEHLRFCTQAQLNTLVESAKLWLAR